MDLRHQSSVMCIIMLGGEDTHPWSATKVGNPIPATIPVTKKTTNKLLKPATMQSTGRNFLKSCYDIKFKKIRLERKRSINLWDVAVQMPFY